MYKTLKNHKKLSCLLFAIIVSFFAYTVTVSAADCVYSTWDNDLVQRISVANTIKDWIRSASYSILRAMASLIDMVEDAIDEVLHLNLYEGVKQFFNFDSWIYPLAASLFLFCLIGCTIFLMVFYNKGRMSAFIKSIIMASFLIAVFPALISSLTDLKDAGVSSVEAIDPSGSTSYVKHSIGDSILSSLTVNMEDSGRYGSERYISQSQKYQTTQDIPYNVNINATIDSDSDTPYKWAVDNAEPISKDIRLYEDLTDDNLLELLGIKSSYDELTEMYDIFKTSTSGTGRHKIENFTKQITHWIRDEGGHLELQTETMRGDRIWYYDICYQTYLKLMHTDGFDSSHFEGVVWDTSSGVFKLTSEYGMRITKTLSNGNEIDVDSQTTTTVTDYKVSPTPKSLMSKLLSYIRSTDTARLLNTIHNEIESEKDTRYDYTYRKLYTDADYEAEKDDWNLDLYVFLSRALSNPFTPVENVYKYDFDFWYGLIVLISVLICLLSAGIRIVRLLLDIIFMQIIGPLVFASDLQESGRTKRLLSEIISSFIVIIIVLLLLKLYIIILLWTFNQNIGWITKLLIIFGGWRFTIDGPDIVTKICGIDAGVKSGQAALLGAYAAARTGVGVARGVGRFARSAASGAYNVVSGVVGGASHGKGGDGLGNTVSRAKQTGGFMKAASSATGYAAGSVIRGAGKAIKPKNIGRVLGSAANKANTVKNLGAKGSAQAVVSNVSGAVVDSAKSAKDKISDKANKAYNNFKDGYSSTRHNKDGEPVANVTDANETLSEPIDNNMNQELPNYNPGAVVSPPDNIDNVIANELSKQNNPQVDLNDVKALHIPIKSNELQDISVSKRQFKPKDYPQAKITRYTSGATQKSPKNHNDNSTTKVVDNNKEKASTTSKPEKSGSVVKDTKQRRSKSSPHQIVTSRPSQANAVADARTQKISSEYDANFNQAIERRKMENSESARSGHSPSNKPKNQTGKSSHIVNNSGKDKARVVESKQPTTDNIIKPKGDQE